tara:strand:- start:3668 stop:3778 length:111 start_codon:yes stop_codon:yes gene_type:complete
MIVVRSMSYPLDTCFVSHASNIALKNPLARGLVTVL